MRKTFVTEFFCLAFTIFLAGCYTWHTPRPITGEGIEKELVPPDMEVLTVRANKIRHPSLKPTTFNGNDGLSPDEAAIAAVLLNPSLKIERDRIAVADAQLLQAGLLPNPVFSCNFDAPVDGNTPGTVNGWGTGVDWDITALITVSAKRKASEENRRFVRLDIAWQETRAAQLARIAVYRLIAFREQVELFRKMEAQLQQKLQLLQRQLDSGMATAIDAASAKNSYNEFHGERLAKEKQAALQLLQLKRLLGLPPDYRLRLQEDISLPRHMKIANPQVLQANVSTRRLDFLALRRGYASQEKAIQIAVLEQIPRINLGINYSRDTGDLGAIGTGASLEIPLFDRNQGQIAIERTVRNKLYDEYIYRVFTAVADIAELSTDINFTNREIRQAETTIADQKKLLRTYKQALDHGQADILVYYDLWNALTHKQISAIDLKLRLAESKIALSVACGYYNPEDVNKEPVHKESVQ